MMDILCYLAVWLQSWKVYCWLKGEHCDHTHRGEYHERWNQCCRCERQITLSD